MNVDHPVVELARTIARKDDAGVFRIDAGGIASLERVLRKHADDPSLPDAILALFEIARFLAEDAASPEAALLILDTIGRLRHELDALIHGAARIRQEDAAIAFGAGPLSRAPLHDEAAPPGTCKASSFVDPGRPPRRLTDRRRPPANRGR